MKNLLVRRSLFLLVIVGLLVLLFQFVRLPFISIKMHEAIPSSSAIFLQFSEMQNVAKIADENGNILLSESAKKDLDLFQKGIGLQPNSPLTVVVRPPDLELLYITKGISKKIKQVENTYKFRNKVVHKITTPEKQEFYVSHFRNLTLMSRRAALVEESLTQLKSYRTSLKKQRNFRRVNRTELKDAAVHVFVSFQNLPVQFSNYLGMKKADNIRNFGKWVNWLKLGLKPTDKGYIVEGAITGNLDFIEYLTGLRDRSINRVLPNNIAAFTQMEAPLVGKFSEDFQKYFQPWIEGEIAYINTEPFGQSKGEKFMLVRSKDTALSEKLLGELGTERGKLETFDYQMFKVEQLLADDVLMPVFGKRLNPIKNPYYTIVEDFVIFCNSKPELQAWLDKYIAGQTLVNEITYNEIISYLNRDNKVLFSLNFERLNALLQDYLKPKHHDVFAQFFKPYESQFSNMTLGLYPKGKRSLFKGAVAIKQEQEPLNLQATTEIVSKIPLSNSLTKAPQVIENPLTKSKIIVVQDKSNALLAFKENGELLWQRVLNEPVLSTIIPLKKPTNEQVEWLFNTSTQIYKINEAGENVANFPMRTGYEMDNGILAVDFDNQGEYELWVAGKGKHIYRYNDKGIPLENAKVKRTGLFRQPLQHFASEDKDFIFGMNGDGELYTFQRNGTPRFEEESTALKADYFTQPSYDELAKRIVVLDGKGRLTIVNTEGKTFKLNTEIGEGQQPQFLYKNIVGDARKDYIVLNNKELSVWYYDANAFKKAWAYTFEFAPTNIFEAGKGIGFFNAQRKEIGFVDTNGALIESKTLGGETPYTLTDLNGDGVEEVVVGCGNEICVYEF